MSDQIACPLCDERDSALWWQGPGIDTNPSAKFSLYRCQKCDFGFVYPFPSEKELSELYPQTFYRTFGSEEKVENSLSKILQWFMKSIQGERVKWIKLPTGSKKILDIGAGSGTFLRSAAKIGWEAYGVEPNFPEKAKMEPLKIHRGSLESFQAPAGSLQVITLWHVLEHMTNFRSITHRAGTLLAPDGKIVIAVPNFQSWEAKCFKGNWALFDVPRHLLFFTPDNVRKLLEESGLTIERESYFSSEFSWPITLQSFLNLFCTEPMFLYNFAKRQYRKKDFHQPGKYMQNLILSFLGTVIAFIPITLMSLIPAALRRGNVYMVSATKPMATGSA